MHLKTFLFMMHSFLIPDASKNTVNQVSSTHFIFSLFPFHILILSNSKQAAAGTKTSKRFME